MPVYTTNIPQPTDNPSVSQGQLLQNFQTLNSVYGTSGDHYAWDDADSTEQGKHAKVTMPGLPTTNAPGNALPSPLAGNCSIFSQTINSQTTPFLSRDGLAPTAPYVNIWPLMPIKAMATISCNAGGDPTINTQFNITSITKNTANQITIVLANAMRTATYGVLALSSSSIGVLNYNITNNTTFRIIDATGLFSVPGALVTIVVLEP